MNRLNPRESAAIVFYRYTMRIRVFPYLTLPYLTLPYLTLPYLTLPYLTLPYDYII